MKVSSYPLGTTFGGVSVSVTQGATTVAALPVYVSAGQINAVMPSNAPLGIAAVKVTFNGQASGVAPVRIVASSPGIFTIAGTGSGPGVVQNNQTDGTVPVNSTQLAAAPNGIITLYGTGLGPISTADNVAPPAGNLPVSVLYSGRLAVPVWTRSY